MPLENRIKEGDFVEVYFQDEVLYERCLEVLYTPCDVGDSWHMRRLDGTLINIQSFVKMVKLTDEIVKDYKAWN